MRRTAFVVSISSLLLPTVRARPASRKFHPPPHLDEVLADFPKARACVQKAARRVTLQRALLKHMCLVTRGKAPASFAPRSAAKGFTTVQLELSLDQKIDRIAVHGGATEADGATGRDAGGRSADGPGTGGTGARGALPSEQLSVMMLAQREELASVKHDVRELKHGMDDLTRMVRQVLQGHVDGDRGEGRAV